MPAQVAAQTAMQTCCRPAVRGGRRMKRRGDCDPAISPHPRLCLTLAVPYPSCSLDVLLYPSFVTNRGRPHLMSRSELCSPHPARPGQCLLCHRVTVITGVMHGWLQNGWRRMVSCSAIFPLRCMRPCAPSLRAAHSGRPSNCYLEHSTARSGAQTSGSATRAHSSSSDCFVMTKALCEHGAGHVGHGGLDRRW